MNDVSKWPDTMRRLDITADTDPKQLNGWMDRDGLLYCCYSNDHLGAADDIADTLGMGVPAGAIELEKRGWLKIGRGLPYMHLPYGNEKPIRPSEAQYAFIHEYRILCDRTFWTQSDEDYFGTFSLWEDRLFEK